jgi:uncharacterized membrane protein YjjP (DUF1212 family)
MKYTAMKKIAMNENGYDIHHVSRFLAIYAAYLWSYGATCIRITKNVNRIARTLDYDVDITILPKHVNVACVGRDGEYSQYTTPTPALPVSYRANSQLSGLSWSVAQGRMNLLEAAEEFERINKEKHLDVWHVLILVVFANASFCRLFGGDPIAMLIVGFATLIGYSIKNICISNKVDLRVMVLCASFVSAVVGSAGYLFGHTSTPDIALGTSVLYLIPGIPYINSVSDMIDGHYICFFSRFMQAVIHTACIAAGLTIAYYAMNIQVF